MKNGLIKLILVLASLSFVGGCSTNTQEQNTTAGVIAGAIIGGGAGAFVGQGVGKAVAIGVGIVAGALIGGYIGNHMDSTDNVHVAKALDSTPTGQTTSWNNPKTHASYAVTPTSNLGPYAGYANCRHFDTTAYIDGKAQRVHGTACRQSNGTWQAVNT